jgi:Holliday junction resolvase RusA-like endonuclease
MNYRKATKEYYEKYAEEFKVELAKHKLPAKIAFTFVRGTRHKFDYINPAQTVQDDMVKAGWIEDDNAEFILPVFVQYTYNKEEPGVYIEILKK